MRFQNILLASLIGAASAYLIPEGTEDGVYEHYLDSAGSEVHVKIANATSFDDADLGAYTGAPASARLKRQNYDVASCAAGPEMDHGVSLNMLGTLCIVEIDSLRTLMPPMPILIVSATTTLLPSLDTTFTPSVVATSLSSATLTTSASTNALRVRASTPAA